MAVRPLHRLHMTHPPNISGPEILNMALTTLEMAQEGMSNAKANPFRWFGDMYVQWRPLAIALAELCVQTQGPLVERAWPIVIRSFNTTAGIIADTNKGMLWRPIEKLMRKAQQNGRIDVSQVLAAGQSPARISASTDDAGPPVAPSKVMSDPTTVPPGQNHVPEQPGPASRNSFTDKFGFLPWSFEPQVNFSDVVPWSLGRELALSDPSFGMVDEAWTNWGDFVQDLHADGSPTMDFGSENLLHGT